MSKDNGFLIFYDWMSALEELSPKNFKMLLTAMCRYQQFQTPPPDFPNNIKALASIIFSQLDRRMKLASYGKKGAEARYSAERGVTGACSGAVRDAGSEVDSSANGRPLPIDKDKDEDENKDKTKTDTKTESVDKTWDGNHPSSEIGSADARAEREEDIFGEKEDGSAEGRKAWGRYGNVYLSTEEYLEICQKIGSADSYIDRFSEKLHSKGYRYPDHFKAICEWWERDKDFEGREPRNERPEEKTEGSFDTDEFFEAAVRRSLGEAALFPFEVAKRC